MKILALHTCRLLQLFRQTASWSFLEGYPTSRWFLNKEGICQPSIAQRHPPATA